MYVKRKDIRSDCPILNKEMENTNDGETNVISDDGFGILIVSTCKYADKWIMDLGCSFHIFHVKHFYIDIKEVDCGRVLLGDNS